MAATKKKTTTNSNTLSVHSVDVLTSWLNNKLGQICAATDARWVHARTLARIEAIRTVALDVGFDLDAPSAHDIPGWRAVCKHCGTRDPRALSSRNVLDYIEAVAAAAKNAA